jgi:hypothetical protein
VTPSLSLASRESNNAIGGADARLSDAGVIFERNVDDQIRLYRTEFAQAAGALEMTGLDAYFSPSFDLIDVSSAGDRVLFTSDRSPDLPTGGPAQLYLYDLLSSTVSLVSTAGGGAGPADDQATSPVLAASGSNIAFVSQASNLGQPASAEPWVLYLSVEDAGGSGPVATFLPKPLEAGSTLVQMTLHFDRQVSGLAPNDFVVEAGSLLSVVPGQAQAGAPSYTVTLSPIADYQGPIFVGLLAGAVIDSFGRGNVSASSPLVAVDSRAPRVTVTDDTAGVATSTVVYTLQFDEIVTDLIGSSVTVRGGTLGAISRLASDDGASRFAITVQPAPAYEGLLELEVAAGAVTDIRGNPVAAFSDASQQVDTIHEPVLAALSGKIYHWKSHALLGGITASLSAFRDQSQQTVEPALVQIREPVLDAQGRLALQLWANGGVGAQHFSVSVESETGISIAFSRDTKTLGAGWVIETSSELSAGGAPWTIAGMTADPSSAFKGLTRIGTLTLDLSPQPQSAELSFGASQIGAVLGQPFTASIQPSRSGSDGTFQIEQVAPGAYQINAASKVLSATESAGAISSADALAALKIAVGQNPNPAGVPVSPYQFLAADANMDGRVSSADALAILKMAVRRSDAPAREWLFVDQSFDVWDETANNGAGGLVGSRTKVPAVALMPDAVEILESRSIDLVATLRGDVDGNWSAPAGSVTLPRAYFDQLVESSPLRHHLSQFGIVTPVI